MAEKRASRKRYAPGEREEIDEAIKAVEAFVKRNAKAAGPPPKAKAAGPPPKAKAAKQDVGASASSSHQPKAKAAKQDVGASASSSHQPKAAAIKGPPIDRLIRVPPTLERIFNEEFAVFEEQILAVEMGSSEAHVRELLYTAKNFTMGSLLVRGFLEKSECSHYLNMRQSGEEVGSTQALAFCRAVELATQLGIDHAKHASQGVKRQGDNEGGHAIDATLIRDIKMYSQSEAESFVAEFSYQEELVEPFQEIMGQFTGHNTFFSSKAWNHARGGGGLLSAVLAIDGGTLPPGFTKKQIEEMVRLYVRGLISSDIFFVFNGGGEYAFRNMVPEGLDQAMICIVARCILRGAKKATSLNVFNATSDAPSKSRPGRQRTDFSSCPEGVARCCEEQVESAVKDDKHLFKWLTDGITTLCAQRHITDIGVEERTTIAKGLIDCTQFTLNSKYTESVVSSVGSDLTMCMLNRQKPPMSFTLAAKIFDTSVELNVLLLTRLYEYAGTRAIHKGALVVFTETFAESYAKREISIPAAKIVPLQTARKTPLVDLLSPEGRANALMSAQKAQSAQNAPPMKGDATGRIHRRSRRVHVNKKTHHYRKYRNRTRRGG